MVLTISPKQFRWCVSTSLGRRSDAVFLFNVFLFELSFVRLFFAYVESVVDRNMRHGRLAAGIEQILAKTLSIYTQFPSTLDRSIPCFLS